MVEEREAASVPDIRETDIVFDCPYCGKSLAIDCRGAGLMITCPDCSNRVQVPIPEGMDVTDLDASQEDERARVIHLREALAEAQKRILRLQEEVEDAETRRSRLEGACEENNTRLDSLLHEVNAIRSSLGDISGALDRMESLIKGTA